MARRTCELYSAIVFTRVRALPLAAALGALALIVIPGHTVQGRQPGACAPPASNPVVCENQQAGAPATEWDIAGSGDPDIQGFATDISVDQGQTVSFRIKSTSPYQLDIYRMGYYDGMGARKVAAIPASATTAPSQPACISDTTTGLLDCGNWAVTASWAVPTTAVSGIYFAKATRTGGGSSHIFFVVRDDDGGSDLLFQTSDTTWQAYNQYGGNSLYVGGPATNPGRAYKVSYNRPFTTRDTSSEDWVFNAEYPMVRWLEANGYNVSYFTGVDSDRRGAEILEHKVFLSVGHDEYWSGGQRTKVETARAQGVHLAFFSGNEIFWKTRWENSIAPGATPYRTLVSYKDTHANAKIDPLPGTWTGTWRDPRFSPPADGGRPENALSGTIFMVNSGTTAIRVPAAEGKLRFWRNTDVATLAPNATATLSAGTLGYEWDEDRDNGFRPPGLMRLSDTTVPGVQYLQDYGSTYAAGTANHALTLYRHSSGALVFGAGTVQWTWGLDGEHDNGSGAPSLPMQQATVNLLADMGVQPITPGAGVVTSLPSTDTVAPSSTIASPAAGASVPANTTITISGAAADTGGGVVGGVEVSVDGGATWHRATGRAQWTYSWATGSARPVTIASRAVDDSGNLGQPGAGINVTVGSGTVTCPCSIWSSAQTPAVASASDGQAVELGTRFRTDVNGFITAVRFYKGVQNTGPHVGNLWTATGTLLASIPFGSVTASGWQEVSLPTPIAVTADTTYIVSYHTASGFYAGDNGYFAAAGVDNGPLHALPDGVDGANGVYKYGASGFPSLTFSSSNYWVDVVFATSVAADTTPPQVTGVTPASGATGVAVASPVTATFSENVNPATVTSSTFQLSDATGTSIAGAVSYTPGSRIATLQPGAALGFSKTYTATVRGGSTGVKDLAGNALATDRVWSFTTGAPPPPPPTDGPGGPILVVGWSGNPFSRYYAEILRNEGLNAFAATDISAVTAAALASYDVVILGEMPLTDAQVTMFSNWVTAGGNLIAMRPDKKLAALLGVTDSGATLAEGYLLVDTAAAPGAGIVAETMQFHGTADRYTSAGATGIATLYSDRTTGTPNPAVTMRNVGAAGGQAAAFAYDLAKSVVYTRQGNPAWSGLERDGVTPIRSDDLFFGGAQPDWVDLTKVAIPQADEQQRLLANMIVFMNRDRKPLPHFWYLPTGLKAAVVMTGDDHGNNGTAGRFAIYTSNSPAGCSVSDWECVRATSYIYPSTPITPAQAAAFVANGFEIGVHITTGCSDYTPQSLETSYSGDLTAFAAIFPALPAPQTNRTHCITWSDYATQPQVALAHGIRFDTNYYYWPDTWVHDVPGMFTGSGMPMRFAKADGTLIDVYQATTQMTDESGQSYPLHIDTLLDRALGPQGYYGVFTANMHTDTAVHAGSEAIVSSALARGVPIVSSKQMLDWLDGRNGSSFGGLTWSGSTLGFTIAVGTGANGLQALVPATSSTGPLTAISRNGSPVAYATQTLKGVSYAIFAGLAGTYQVSYASDTTAPVITGLAASAAQTTATVTWTTNEAATSRVDYGTSPASLTLSASPAVMSTGHSVVLTGLSPATQYFYKATSADASGNTTTAPASAATFTTAGAAIPAITIADRSVTEGNTGTTNAAVTLTLSAASASVVTVQYATAASPTAPATAGTDYTSASGTATFAAGATTTTVNVPIVGDTVVEPNETFVVNLTVPVNATIADAQAVVTIANDDSVAAGLPAPWQTQDIGAVGRTGSASFAAATSAYAVTGAGADIWNAADAFRYVYQPLTGDGQIVARVVSVQNTNAWVKAGVMIRADLTAGSAHAMMMVTPGKGNNFQRRLAAGGISTSTAGAAVVAPYWVRLARSGSTLTASESANGTAWTVVGSATIALPATAWVGLAVSSHSSTTLATATFDQVSIGVATPGLPAPWQTQDVGAVGRTGSASFAAATSAYAVTGAGADIWNAADAFRYVYQPLTGDGQIVARVVSVQNTNAWVKAGVMIRADLTAGSAHAMMMVTPGKGNNFQRRLAAGGISTSTAGAAVVAPYWVRLARTGNTLTASESANGTAWTVVGSATIALPATAWVGLAVSSHSGTTLATATFDQVSIGVATSGLPAPWRTQDVGAVGRTGSASFAAATSAYAVTGAGADIWGAADAFRYLYQPLTGDGQIVARVVSVQNTNVWAKAGVMIRADLTAGSPHAMMLVTPGKGNNFQRRLAAGGISTTAPGAEVVAPYWVRLARTGNTLTASESANGTAWTVVGSATIALPATAWVGLAVSSHSTTTPATATFDQVSIAGP